MVKQNVCLQLNMPGTDSAWANNINEQLPDISTYVQHIDYVVNNIIQLCY